MGVNRDYSKSSKALFRILVVSSKYSKWKNFLILANLDVYRESHAPEQILNGNLFRKFRESAKFSKSDKSEFRKIPTYRFLF